ncbi:MAG: tryptophan--tRNA ligase [Sandaracinus sp.]|mgnify:CR=1 FL=1|nr:tryptophan--tRNA ligase [Sandaracinus sp.]MAR57087.1 tryptophan--tRNA ligase [Rickettsiales bacterium]
MRSVKTSLTGIKPTNTPHLGNYLGAIRPALKLAETYRSLYFIADYHALTTMRDPAALQESIYDVAATWLAAGLDPNQTILFRQSAVPEVFELSWVLSCLLATGQLERGHSYKDALAKGDVPNAGVFYYPVLMAADILLYDTDVVPVGKDQKQHVELCRDVAQRVNHVFGEDTLVVPEVHVGDAPLVPGIDGEKMSKSRGNGIPLFAPAKKLRKVVMSIKTGSESLEEPKEPEGSTVYQLCKQVSPEAAEAMATELRKGGYGWGHAKQALFEALEAELGPRRDVYQAMRADTPALDRILDQGADRARAIAHKTIGRVRHAVGISATSSADLKKTVRLKPQVG